MKNVFRLFFVLGCVFGLCLYAGATDAGPSAPPPAETEPTVPVVAIDDDSIQAIADALVPTEPVGDNSADDTEPTIPQVELAPDTVDALSDAVGSAVGDAIAGSQVSPFVLRPPSADAVLSGYYFYCNCNLGDDIRFWVPVEFGIDKLSRDGDNVINMSSDTLVLLADSLDPSLDLTGYRFYAGPMSTIVYTAPGEPGLTHNLVISSFHDSNINFLTSDINTITTSQFFILLISVIFIFGFLIAFVKR